MPLKIVRNDITTMACDAIVNTANENPVIGPGCDTAIYRAAGTEKLLAYRKEKIGHRDEGEVFLTPGFELKAEYIIHAVSPRYVSGWGTERKLRSCYRKSLNLAEKTGITSIAFPLIATGSFGYPKEEGMRIAIDEIQAHLLHSDLQVYLVVFDEKAVRLGSRLYPDLESYIDSRYVELKNEEEYRVTRQVRYSESNKKVRRTDEPGCALRKPGSFGENRKTDSDVMPPEEPSEETWVRSCASMPVSSIPPYKEGNLLNPEDNEYSGASYEYNAYPDVSRGDAVDAEREKYEEEDFEDVHAHALAERMKHLSDTFSEYLLYLIRSKRMTNAEVYKRAIVDKKAFSKIKNNRDAHPQKLTCMCLCVGAKLNLDETKDLLARAGYALSPCEKTDIIFSYFIEHEIYDMIELDIQLEEHGCPCIIV